MQSRKTGFADLTGGFPQRRIYSADIRKAFRRGGYTLRIYARLSAEKKDKLCGYTQGLPSDMG